MNKGTSVRSRLLRYVNNQKKEDTHYLIASAILENFTDIPQITIYSLAEKCFVSTSSISRFIRLIGFNTYTDFKSASEEEIDISNDYAKEMLQSKIVKETDFIDDYTNNVINNLSFFKENVPVSKIKSIVSDIHEADDVAFFGLEFAAFMGQHFQNKMASVDKIIQIGFTMEEQIKLAENLQPNSVALIFSVEGGFYYFHEKVVSILIKKKIKIIAFTFKNSPIIERNAHEVLICGESNRNTEGRIAILYVMEVIIYYYMKEFHLK